MYMNSAIQRPPWGAALRANKEAATAHAAAAEIRGLKAPFEQGDSVPPHPPRLMGKCNCRRAELVVDAEQSIYVPIGNPLENLLPGVVFDVQDEQTALAENSGAFCPDLQVSLSVILAPVHGSRVSRRKLFSKEYNIRAPLLVFLLRHVGEIGVRQAVAIRR